MDVKGHYDGRVVVIDGPAPVDREVDVIVRFPDNPEDQTVEDARRRHWMASQDLLKHVKCDPSEEVIRQRRLE
jgi:hypothetical protein